MKINRSGSRYSVIVSLFLLSFGAGLFSICIFKLLGFLLIPTSFFIILLLFGMPLGGLLSLKYFTNSTRGFLKSLTLLQIAMVFSIFITFLCIRVSSPWLLYYFTQSSETFLPAIVVITLFIILESIMFIPFFAAYGACEFVGYQYGMKYLHQKSSIVYAIYLFGLTTAFVFLRGLLGPWGIIHFIIISILTIIIVKNILLKKRGSILRNIFMVSLLVCIRIPSIDDKFMSLIEHKKSPIGESFSFNKEGFEVVYRKWSKYVYLTFIKNIKTEYIVGYYNGMFIWAYPKNTFTGKEYRKAEETKIFPYFLLDEDAKVAIIGAGGGRQVGEALKSGIKDIYAIEIIPEVIEVLQNELSYYVDNVFNQPEVKVFKMEGRRFLNESKEKFDLIYIPHTESAISTLKSAMEVSSFLFTLDSFREMRGYLNEGGIIVIEKSVGLDFKGIKFRQYFRQLKSLGFVTHGIVNNQYFLDIIKKRVGTDDIDRNKISASGLDRSIIIAYKGKMKKGIEDSLRSFIKQNGFIEVSEIDSSDIVLITDDKPYNASIFSTFLDLKSIYTILLGLLPLIILLILGLINFMKKRTYSYGISSKNFYSLFLSAFFVGINFICMENFIIFKLYKFLSTPLDAVFIGTIIFLMLTGFGSLFLSSKKTPIIYLLVATSIVCYFVFNKQPPIPLLIILPLALLSGTFFPSLFWGQKERLFVVFAIDAVGTLVGGLVSLFIPIFIGFKVFYTFTIFFFIGCFLLLTFYQRFFPFPPPKEDEADTVSE